MPCLPRPCQPWQNLCLELPDSALNVFMEPDLEVAAPFSALTRARLKMHYCTVVPSDTSALTGLRNLQLRSVDGVGVMDGILQHLQQLTLLRCEESFSAGLPPALGQLPSLQRCLYWGVHPEGQQAGQLPQGPWISGLCYLGAPWAALVNSVPVLAAAEQLQHLGIMGIPDAERRMGRLLGVGRQPPDPALPLLPAPG